MDKKSRALLVATLATTSILYTGGGLLAADLTADQQAVYDAVVAKFGEQITNQDKQITELQGWTRDLYTKSSAMPTSGTGDGIALGVDSVAKWKSAIAIGNRANASEEEYANIAIGTLAQALGGSTIAIGAGAESITNGAVAIGTNVKLTDENDNVASNSIGIGHSVYSNGVRSILIGSDIGKVDDPNSNNYMVGIGYNVNPSYDSVAIGNFASTSPTGVAIGAGAHTLHDNGVAIGFTSFAGGPNSVALGHNSYAFTDGVANTSYLSGETFSADNGIVAIGNNFELNLGNNVAPINHRRITGLAGGADDYDAVNVKQLKALSTAVDARIANKISTSSGVEYVDINSKVEGNKDNSGASGTDSIAIGPDASASAANTVALGSNVKASIDNAIVIGSNITDGKGIVIGVSSSTTSNHSVAIGVEANASGNARNTAVGWKSIATGNYSVAYGQNSNALGESAVALGTSVTANGNAGIAIGNKAVSNTETKKEGSIAIGDRAHAESDSGVAIGTRSIGSGDRSIALGFFSEASGVNSASLGANSLASGLRSVAMGASAKAKADRAIALGSSARAEAEQSIALGSFSMADRASGSYGYVPNGTVFTSEADIITYLGKVDEYNALTAQAIDKQKEMLEKKAVSDANPDDKTLYNAAVKARDELYAIVDERNKLSAAYKSGLGAVSVGTAYATRQITNVAAGTEDTDAVNVAQFKALNTKVEKVAEGPSGYVHVNTTGQDLDPVARNFGLFNDPAGAGAPDSIAIGPDVTVSKGALSGVAIGHLTNVANEDGISIGHGTNSIGDRSVALGFNSIAGATDAVVIGPRSSASGLNSLAVGNNNKSTAAYSYTFGQENETTGQVALAMGYGNKAKGLQSIAIGVVSETGASADSALAIGTAARAFGYSSMAIGSASTISGNHSVGLGYLSTIERSGINGTALGRNTYIGAVRDSDPEVGIPNNSIEIVESDTNPEEGKEQMNSVAVGHGAKSFGYQALSIGSGAETYDTNTIAIGVAAKAKDHYATAIGKQAYAEGKHAMALGHWTRTTGENSVAIGTYSIIRSLDGTTDVNRSATLGSYSRAASDNSVALGNNSLAYISDDVSTEAYLSKEAFNKAQGIVSVGNAKYSIGDYTVEANRRRITNVAGGADEYDAVNVKQLDALNTALTTKINQVSNTITNEVEYVSINSKLDGNKNSKGAVGEDSIAIGPNASASAANIVALGSNVAAGTDNAIVIGSNITDGKGIVIGVSSVATSDLSVAIGKNTVAGDSNQADVAIGNYAKARGLSVAIGDGANAFDINDSTSDASGLSVAIGSKATATGQGGVAVGNLASATFQSNAMGSEAKATGRGSVSIGDTSKAIAAGAIALGNRAKAEDTFSMALGTYAEAPTSGSIAIGGETKANGGWSLAVGRGTEANGEMTTALGYKTMANGYRSIAIGPWANTEEGRFGTAIGYNAKTKGTNTIALGGYTEAFNDKAMALGYASEGNVESGVALGAYSVVDRESGAFGYTVDGVTFSKAEDIAKYLGKDDEYKIADDDFKAKLAVYREKSAALEVDKENEQLQAEVKTAYAETSKSYDARNAIISSYLSGLGAVSVGTAADTRQITNVAAGTEDTDAVNVAQLKALREAGLNFKGDATDVLHRGISEQLNIVGGATVSDLTDNNIGIVASGTDTLTVKLAKNIKLADGSVAFSEVGTDADGNLLVKGKDGNWYTDLTDAVYDEQSKSYTKDNAAVNPVEKPVVGTVKLSSTGLDNGNQRITNVAEGTADTDAVNYGQLLDELGKVKTSVGGNHTELKVDGTSAVKDKYVGEGSLTLGLTEVNGKKVYDLKLNNDVTIGSPGKEGKPGEPGEDAEAGSITIIGEKGKDGADGTPGKNAVAEITVKEGTPGVDGKDGETITRIVYETGEKGADGKPIVTEVATLNDGMKFAGDDFKDGTNRYVAKKLNERLDIKGGAAADSLTDNNIGVVADVDSKDNKIIGLRVKLAKNLALNDGSVAFTETAKDADGNALVKGKDGNWYTDLTDAVYDEQSKSYTKDNAAVNPVEKPVVGTVKLSSTGLDNGNQRITNVAEGTADTDAVNYGQLLDELGKVKTSVGGNHTELKVDGTSAVKDEYVGEGSLTLGLTEVNGKKVYDLKLNNDVTIGSPGKEGKPGEPGEDAEAGSITIIGEKGKDGADGTPGKNAVAEITVKEGTPGVDGKDGETITRIVYETGEKGADGKPIVTEVATLNDGMKFAGDDFKDGTNRYVAKKLNERLDIKGGAAADSLTDNNIGVVADVDSKDNKIIGLRVKLAKNLALNDGSVAFTETAKDADGNALVKGRDGNWYADLTDAVYDEQSKSYTKDNAAVNPVEKPVVGAVKLSSTGLDNGNQRITNVAEGTADTDAVNYGQLLDELGKVKTSVGGNHTELKVDGTSAVKDKYVGEGSLTLGLTEVNGKKVYDLKLNNDVTIGNPGKEGKPGEPGEDAEKGTITIIGEKGKDGADGTPGKNAVAEITVKEGTPGVDGKDGETITRIVYETGEKGADGKPIVTEVATLNDGMKFAGDDFKDGTNRYVAKKLNERLDIKGGAATDSLTDNNIGVVADVDSKDNKIIGLRVKLAKNINLPDDGSVRIGGTTDEKGTLTGGIYIGKQTPMPKVGDKDVPDKAVEGRYITGLTNIDWNPEAGIVENRAATEKQLQTAISNISSQVGEAGVWKLQVNGAGERSIKKNEIINFKDGEKIKVTQSGNDITIGVDPAFVKEVTDNTSNITTLNTRVTKVEGKVTNLEEKVNNITDNGIVTKVEGDAVTGVKVTPVDEADATKGVKVSLDEKITIGGIVIDGTKPKDGEIANSTITGLTNTKWDGKTFESGRAATEDQLHAVDGKITNIIDNITEIAGATTIKEGDGNIIAPKTDGKNEYTLSLNKDLKVGNSITVGDTVKITNTGIISNVEAVELEENGNYAATTGQVFEVRETLSEQISGVANVVQNNSHQISRLDTKINKSGAGLAALAALHPLDYDPDNKWNFTAGVGTYHGSSSVALGAFYRPNENTMFSVGGTLGNGEDMMNFGVSMKFGESNPYAGMSKGRLIEYVEQQTTEIDDLKAQNESQNERIKKLEELVQSLMISK